MTESEAVRRNRIKSAASSNLNEHLTDQANIESALNKARAAIGKSGLAKQEFIDKSARIMARLSPDKQGEFIKEVEEIGGKELANSVSSRMKIINTETTQAIRRAAKSAKNLSPEARRKLLESIEKKYGSKIANRLRSEMSMLKFNSLESKAARALTSAGKSAENIMKALGKILIVTQAMSFGQDIIDYNEGKISREEMIDKTLAVVTLGAAPLAKEVLHEYNVTKSQEQDIEKNLKNAQEQEDMLRVLKITKELLNNKVKKQEVKEIIKDFLNGKKETLDTKIEELKKKGIQIQIPPRHIVEPPDLYLDPVWERLKSFDETAKNIIKQLPEAIWIDIKKAFKFQEAVQDTSLGIIFDSKAREELARQQSERIIDLAEILKWKWKHLTERQKDVLIKENLTHQDYGMFIRLIKKLKVSRDEALRFIQLIHSSNPNDKKIASSLLKKFKRRSVAKVHSSDYGGMETGREGKDQEAKGKSDKQDIGVEDSDDKTGEIKKDNDTNKSKADSLIEEGSKLVEQDRLKEALEKFEESLKHSPDQQIEDYVETIKKELALRDTEDKKESTETEKGNKGQEVKGKSDKQNVSVEDSDNIGEAKSDLDTLARQKWDWFKKDVPRYLNELFAKSEGEYGILERRVNKAIAEKKGTQEEVDKCLENSKKQAKALRKLIGEAKKEHPKVLQKMHDDQGSATKVLKHIKEFVVKYKIPDDLKVSVNYSSPCLEKSDEKFSVEISGVPLMYIDPKEIVNLRAVVSGGKAPVKVSWEGDNISPSGKTAIFTATIPGTYTVQVAAKDASGQSISDFASIKVKKMIEQSLTGLGDTVYYGTTVPIEVLVPEGTAPEEKGSEKIDCKKNPNSPFCVSTKPCKNPFDEDCRVRIMEESDGTKAGAIIGTAGDAEDMGPAVEEKLSEYEYVWQPAGEGMEFDPPNGKIPKVNVTFGKIGDVEIWAEIHKDNELVGETKRIKTKIIPPEFSLNVVPRTLYVGDEGKAIITLMPNIDDKFTDFRWLPMGKNAQKLIEAENGRSTTLKLKSIKPTMIEVLVHAKSPYYGGQIGSVKYVVSAKPYKVDVKVLGPLGPKPRVWKEGKGLVEVDKEIAIHQNVRMKANITPEPKNTTIRYSWKLNEDSHFAGGSSGSEVMLNRSQTGTCTATVTIKDKDGNVLGKGSGSFAVTISQQQIDTGKQKSENGKRDEEKKKQKAKDQKKAKELLQEARKLWKDGKLQQAITKIAQAQKLAGKDKEITKTLNKLDAAKKVLDSAAMISAKYEKYKKVLKQLNDAKKKAEEKRRQIAKLLKEAKILKDAGKLDEAIKVLKKGSKEFPGNKEIGKLLKDRRAEAVERGVA